MASRIRFETPENIQVGYDLAGLGSRFAAWVLDQCLVTFVVIVSFIALLITGEMGDSIVDDLAGEEGTTEGEIPAYVIGIFYLLYSVGSFFYFGLCELYMRGQTIGKRKLAIRVVQANGFELRPTSILLRTVFRVIDHLPPFWIVPFATDRQCRLGDLVAGTVVVSERPRELSPVRRTILERPSSEATFRFGNALNKVSGKRHRCRRTLSGASTSDVPGTKALVPSDHFDAARRTIWNARSRIGVAGTVSS